MAQELTYLQFLVLSHLLGEEHSGRELRKKVDDYKQLSLASFYQLMARLEDAKMVEGWYTSKSVDGVPVKERHYKIIAGGTKAWNATRRLYEDAAKIGKPGLAWGGA